MAWEQHSGREEYVIKTEQGITGTDLPSMDTLYTPGWRNKAQDILKDTPSSSISAQA